MSEQAMNVGADAPPAPPAPVPGPPADPYGVYRGKFDSNTGTYTAGQLDPDVKAIYLSRSQAANAPQSGYDTTKWKTLTADKIKALRGRIEESDKKKSQPRVKFVRSGKRWGFFVG